MQEIDIKDYDLTIIDYIKKKTNILLIPYEGFSSSKVTKAQSIPGIKIIPINDFLANMGNYVEV